MSNVLMSVVFDKAAEDSQLQSDIVDGQSKVERADVVIWHMTRRSDVSLRRVLVSTKDAR